MPDLTHEPPASHADLVVQAHLQALERGWDVVDVTGRAQAADADGWPAEAAAYRELATLLRRGQDIGGHAPCTESVATATPAGWGDGPCGSTMRTATGRCINSMFHRREQAARLVDALTAEAIKRLTEAAGYAERAERGERGELLRTIVARLEQP